MKRRKILAMILSFILVIMILPVVSQNVWAADAGTREDALKWVYGQEGKFLDYDKAYGAQCVDLIKYYYAYFGKASYAKGNGCDYVSNALPEGWTRIKNTADFVPEPGDIAVWGTELSSAGHVAIVLSANTHSFISMDQNWPKGSACKQVSHTYNKFWGVIRPNFKSSLPNPSISGKYWGNMTDTTFRPVVVINNPETVKEVKFAIWTTSDQSDLKWYDARSNGVGGYFQDINFSDFSNKKYICHVYVYGLNGSVQSSAMESLDNYDYSQPSINGIYWGDTTDATFRPVIEISNPTSVKEVKFAVWTTSDQSDLKWYDARNNGVGGYFQDIKYSDFPNQHYFCHAYVYGNNGSTQSIALNDFDTYNAEGEYESAAGGIGCVTIKGFAFDKSNKKENIYVHCYAKDANGNATFLGQTLANQEREDVNNKYSVGSNHGFSQVFITSLSGTYTVEVSAMNIGGGNAVTFLGAKTVTIKQPTVNFDSCGGSKCESIKVTNTQDYGTLPTPTRAGYKFEGWYTEKEDGYKITEDDNVRLTEDQTLYAHWTKNCEHKNTEVRNAKEATFDEEGYTGDTYCKDCGEKIASGEKISKKAYEWKSGENVLCSLGSDGVMTISGNGAMKNYSYKSEMPWFKYNDKIKSVVVEKGVTSIGDYAFYGMPNMTAIQLPEGIKTIGEYAFKNSTKLDKIELPSTVKKIGESAFFGCTGLTKINIPEGIYTIWGYTFKNCTNLAEITLPSTLIKIDEAAFYGCTSLKELQIPDNVSIIGIYCFKNCSNLSTLTLPKALTGIREAAFYGTGITELVIPKNVKTIGKYAFKNCVKLNNIQLPEALKKIDDSAFYSCTGLTILEIPDNVTEICDYAFRKCTGIQNVKFSQNLTKIGESAFYGCESMNELNLPDSITNIGSYAFKNCSNVKKVQIPEALETIKESSFYGCIGIIEIEIPTAVESIENYAFASCSALRTMYFNGDRPEIGAYAFARVSAKAYYPSENATWTQEVMQNYGGTLTWISDRKK